MPALRRIVNELDLSCQYNSQHATLVDIASAAEDIKCWQIVTVCEAIIVKRFNMFVSHQALAAKLSTYSLLRLAKGIQRYQEDITDRTYDEYTDMARKLKWDTLDEQVCPVCNKPLQRSKKRNVMHVKRTSRCPWPYGALTAEEPPVSEIAHGMVQRIKAGDVYT